MQCLVACNYLTFRYKYTTCSNEVILGTGMVVAQVVKVRSLPIQPMFLLCFTFHKICRQEQYLKNFSHHGVNLSLCGQGSGCFHQIKRNHWLGPPLYRALPLHLSLAIFSTRPAWMDSPWLMSLSRLADEKRLKTPPKSVFIGLPCKNVALKK